MKISYYKVFKCNFSYFRLIMDENFRFIQILDKLKEKGVVTDYVQVANTLGTNKASISDIKSGRKKLSIDLLRRMKTSYPSINIEWIIMGEGEAFAVEVNDMPATSTSDTSYFIEKIVQQAEEIGALKQTIIQLEKEKGHLASGVNNSQIADAG